ncbi:Myosin heavy chain, fast skeletal muscle, partial [Clarias magur]
ELLNQARQYKTLQKMYKAKNRPNKKDVSQLLDLEFQARRSFIDSESLKEQDRPGKILQAYPCFRELDH